MNKLLLVCLVAITLGGVNQSAAAQTPPMRKGVSVQMVTTNNAQPMPGADEENARIVSVSNDGRLWFGINPVTRGGLVDEMIRTPRHRDQNLYIKADARVPYADVAYVLKAAHTAEFDAPVLLTAQQESPQPGTIVLPKGLEVLLQSAALGGLSPVELEVVSAQSSPFPRVNGQQTSWANLQNKLRQLFQSRTENVVRLKADGALPFAQVVHAIDVCRSAGAKVVLATPEN